MVLKMGSKYSTVPSYSSFDMCRRSTEVQAISIREERMTIAKVVEGAWVRYHPDRPELDNFRACTTEHQEHTSLFC